MLRKSIIAAVLAVGVSMAATSFSQAAGVGAGQRVLVLPFTTLNIADSQQWIAKAVQEDIVADFGHNGGFAPVAFQSQLVVEDNATAARLAKSASAPYVVRGAAQQIDQTIRLTAQLIDSASGDTISTASATGSVADLLKLEDSLSQQLRGAQAVDATPMTSAAPTAVSAPTPPPVQYAYQQPAPIYYTPDYASPYGYYDSGYSPYYGYGSSFPIVIISSGSRFGFRGGFHHIGGGFGGGGFGGHGGFHNPFPAPVTFGARPTFRGSFGGSLGGARSFGGGSMVGFSGGFSGGHHR